MRVLFYSLFFPLTNEARMRNFHEKWKSRLSFKGPKWNRYCLSLACTANQPCICLCTDQLNAIGCACFWWWKKKVFYFFFEIFAIRYFFIQFVNWYCFVITRMKCLKTIGKLGQMKIQYISKQSLSILFVINCWPRAPLSLYFSSFLPEWSFC